MAEQRDEVGQMAAAEEAEYWRHQGKVAAHDEYKAAEASEIVRLASEIIQELWAEGRRVCVQEARYPDLLLLAEMGLYVRLKNMTARGWVDGWHLSGPERTDVIMMAPGGTAAVLGSPTMQPGTWMVLRTTPTAGAPAGRIGELNDRAV